MHTHDHSSAIKEKEILPLQYMDGTRGHQGNEIRQTEGEKYCMISQVGRTTKNKQHKVIDKKK